MTILNVLSFTLNLVAVFALAGMSAAARDLREQVEVAYKRLHTRCGELAMWRRRYPREVFSTVHPWDVEKRMLPSRYAYIGDLVIKDDPFAVDEKA